MVPPSRRRTCLDASLACVCYCATDTMLVRGIPVNGTDARQHACGWTYRDVPSSQRGWRVTAIPSGSVGDADKFAWEVDGLPCSGLRCALPSSALYSALARHRFMKAPAWVVRYAVGDEAVDVVQRKVRGGARGAPAPHTPKLRCSLTDDCVRASLRNRRSGA